MRYLNVFLTILFLTSFAGVESASAQNATATSQLAGLEIDLGPSGEGAFLSTSPEPYEIDGYIQEDFEIWYQSAVIYISFVQGDVSPQLWHDDSIATLNQDYSEFEVLQEDISANHSTAIFGGVYWMDFSILTYSEYQVGVAENVSMSTVVHSGESSFVEMVEWATTNITIGGDPFGQHLDRGEMQAAIDGTSETPPRIVPVPTSTRLDWASAGLISDTEWQSPNTEINISWDSSLWAFPYFMQNPITVGTEYPEDYISIVTPDHRGQADLLVFENSEAVTPESWLTYLTSSDTIAAIEQNGFTIEIMDSAMTEHTASVILKMTDRYGSEFMAIYDVYFTPEFTIMSHIYAAPDAIGDVYQAYWDAVKANADFYPLTWTLEEIHALSDGAGN